MNDRIKEIVKQNGFSGERAERITEEVEEFAEAFICEYLKYIHAPQTASRRRFDYDMCLGVGEVLISAEMRNELLQMELSRP